jgi:hypothetical protein
MEFIDENETRYNTDDLNCLFDALYTYCKTGQPNLLGEKWEGCSWYFGAESLPIKITTWSGYTKGEIVGFRNIKGFTPTWGTATTKVPGPWFCERAKKRRSWDTTPRKLRILCPAAVAEYVPPMEALAQVADGNVLPKTVVTNILYRATKYMGIGMHPGHHRVGNFTRSDDVLLLSFVAAFVEARDLKVRIEKRIQTTKEKKKSSKEEKVERLLELYRNGGSARAMDYKLWALRADLTKYFDSWLKTETHYKSLSKNGVETDRHASPSQLLRELAETYEELEKEKKK